MRMNASGHIKKNKGGLKPMSYDSKATALIIGPEIPGDLDPNHISCWTFLSDRTQGLNLFDTQWKLQRPGVGLTPAHNRRAPWAQCFVPCRPVDTVAE